MNRFTKLIYLAVLLTATNLSAQLTISSPATDTKIYSCDDFFTTKLNNPADMNETTDILNRFPGVDVSGVTNTSFSGGVFNFDTTNTASTLYLFAPRACGSYAKEEREGPNLNIDTSKYKKFAIRMYSSINDDLGFRFIWDRGCNYANDRSVTVPFAIKQGWHTYEVDLTTIAIDPGTNTNTWASGNINGFAILPTVTSGTNIKIDWITLYDASSCSSGSSSYNFSTTANNSLANIWLDDDLNPFNGYIKKIASATTDTSDSLSFSAPVFPGNFNIIGLLDSDYATLEKDNPWDMNSSDDILVTSNISNISYTSGLLQGTTTASGPNIYLKVGDSGIDASKYSKVSFKVQGSTQALVIWNGSSSGQKTLTSPTGDFQYDLDSNANWSGTINNLIIRPVTTSGTNFALDFVSLRASGYDTSRDADSLVSSIVSSAGTITVNNQPYLKILQPDFKGGESVKVWNMNQKDIVLTENLATGTDPNYPTEDSNSFLPDVRLVNNLRGDFFKGTSKAADDDPAVWLSFPLYNENPLTFDSSEYKNLCYKILVDTPFDLGAGSVVRVIYKLAGGGFQVTEDLVLNYDVWDGTPWEEYCVDMSKVWLDGTESANWTGTIDAFRIDPHEFHYPDTKVSFYLDYVKLRKNDRADNNFQIVYELSDEDLTDDPEVQFYYNTTNTSIGGTLINTTALKSSDATRTLAWDTTGIADGTYYVYGIATDGVNSTSRISSGPVVIKNTGATQESPILFLESVSEGMNTCNQLQVKGYSLLSNKIEDVALVEIIIDGELYGVTYPESYSPLAKSTYPDSNSSNSGLDYLVDTTGLAIGAHTLTINAVSSTKKTTKNYNFTKSTSSCPSVVTDASPSGTPIAAADSMTPPAEPKVAIAPSVAKISYDSKGTLKFTLQKLLESDVSSCSFDLEVATTKKKFTSPFKTYTARKATYSIVTKKLLINKRKLSKFYLKVTKNCDGYDPISRTSKAIVPLTTTGIKDIPKLSSALSKKIKLK